MRIKLLLFAQLREALGAGETDLCVEEGATINEVVRSLFSDEKLQHLKEIPLLYSRNENFAAGDAKLAEYDTLALLPPVAGG